MQATAASAVAQSTLVKTIPDCSRQLEVHVQSGMVIRANNKGN